MVAGDTDGSFCSRRTLMVCDVDPAQFVSPKLHPSIWTTTKWNWMRLVLADSGDVQFNQPLVPVQEPLREEFGDLEH
jgi:hypothetical protein